LFLFRVVIMRKRLASVNPRMLAQFAGSARRAAGLHGRVDVLITSSTEMRGLNLRFRGKDAPTDVLSFPSQSDATPSAAGDIAISADIARANAARLGHSVGDEIKVLILHGVLHLAGYDHETDGGRMARKERKLRRELRLPESLIERTVRKPSRTGLRSRLSSKRRAR
jgi:probable rRNA maturation factor